MYIIITPSKFSAKELESLTGFPRNKIHVDHSGLSSHFTPSDDNAIAAGMPAKKKSGSSWETTAGGRAWIQQNIYLPMMVSIETPTVMLHMRVDFFKNKKV